MADLANHSRVLSEKRLKEANDVKSKYDKSCEEIEMLQAEVKRLTTQLDNNIRPATNEDSSRNPELIGLRDQVWDLQLANERLRSTNEGYLKQIENANYEGYWRTRYNKLWDSQGDYETGFRDGSKNSTSYLNSPQYNYQKTISDMKKVWDQVRKGFYLQLSKSWIDSYPLIAYTEEVKTLRKKIKNLQEEVDNLSEVTAVKPKKRRLSSLRNLEEGESDEIVTNKSIQVDEEEIKWGLSFKFSSYMKFWR